MKNTIASVVAIALAGIALLIGVTSKPVITNTTVGALAGPDISSPYLSVSNVRREFKAIPMTPATTTICSSLDYFSLIVNVGTTTAATVDVGATLTDNKGLTATTTLFIQSYAIASGAQGSVILPGALPTVATSTILAPNTRVNAKTNEVGVGGYTYGGQCNAVMTVFQTL